MMSKAWIKRNCARLTVELFDGRQTAFAKRLRGQMQSLLIVSLFLLATPAAYSQMPALTGADFVRVPVESLSARGIFVVPNEKDYHLVSSEIRRKTGAYLAVGTFRALAGASVGAFDLAVLFDTDSETADFNRFQIEVLKQSSSAIDFLMRLSPNPGWRPLIARAVHGERDALDELRRRMISDYQEHRFRAAQMPSEDFQKLRLLDLRAYYVETLTSLVHTDNRASFLSDPVAFDRLKKMAVADRLVVVTGNLGGPSALKRIGEILRQKKISISVFDISNALPYVENHGQLDNYLENLRALPFSLDAVVISTAPPSREHPDWSYFSLGAAEYVHQAAIDSDGLPVVSKRLVYGSCLSFFSAAH